MDGTKMYYEGSANIIDASIRGVFINAFAISYISVSELSRLKQLTAHKMIRQLFCVYGPAGLIRSMLGDIFLFLYPTLLSGPEKGNPVNSQYPVQRPAAHSGVRSKSICFIFARRLAPVSKVLHG